MENQKKYYITTPIYYPSDNLHIGHAYCHRGGRHHGPLQEACRATTPTSSPARTSTARRSSARPRQTGVTPQAYVDEIVAGTKDLWKLMDIDYDDFIRTTDERHVKAVQKIFQQLYEQGDIYKSEYEGWYCTPCESFWTPSCS